MSDSCEVEQGTPAQSIFLQKLHSMINNESHTGCVDWMPDGKGFAVFLKQKFEANILPVYFGQAKYTSFTRRLKRWGFRRISHAGAYYHDRFQRDMAFDIDFEEEHPTVMNSIPTKTLPLKKRSFEEQRLSQHGSPTGENSDVLVMPELMRTINRRKRKEKREEGREAVSRPAKMTRTHQESTTKRASTLEQSVDAAQTLASFGQRKSPQDSFGRLAANRPLIENFHLSPPLYNGYTSLERGMMNTQSKVRQMKRYEYSHCYDDNASDFSSSLYLSKNEEYNGLCQLTSDSRREPIRNLQQRKIPAFNRAA